jgi:predicted HNH restriction endonuclease
LLGEGTELRLDRVVPERTARALRRESGKSVKIASDEYRVNQQTLRTTGRITAESAALLDDVLLRSSRVPIDPRAYREGSRAMRVHIAIERSAGVRRAALAIHGPKCQVCGFSFSKTYGKIGAGFAEVHHLEPFKNVRSAKFVNPATDVVVLCANCHRMVHRRDPPLTPNELRASVELTRSATPKRRASAST